MYCSMCSGSNNHCLKLGQLLHEKQELYIPTSILVIALTQVNIYLWKVFMTVKKIYAGRSWYEASVRFILGVSLLGTNLSYIV